MDGIPRGAFGFREQLARIDRALAETEKFRAEQRKLTREATKLERDRRLSPWLVVVGVLGSIGGIIAGVSAVLRLLGRLP